MLSIIILNYKTSKDISICLQSIVRMEPSYNNYEFIIVDNNSEDPGIKNIKNDYPFVKIIYALKNGGFAYGNNIGIKESKGDYILLLNPDTYIKDNAIEKLYNRLKNDSDIDLIGPQLFFPDESNQSYFLPKTYLTLWRLFCERFYLFRIFNNSKIFNSYYRTYINYNKECYVEQISGAAFMFKKHVIEKIGYLDENYFLYFEESDYCFKAVRNKLKLLYYPESKIIHTAGASNKFNSARSSSHYINSLKYYFKKNFNKIYYYTALLIYIIGSLIRTLILRIKGEKKDEYYFNYIKYLFDIK